MKRERDGNQTNHYFTNNYRFGMKVGGSGSYFVSGFEGMVVVFVQHRVPHLDFVQLKKVAS